MPDSKTIVLGPAKIEKTAVNDNTVTDGDKSVAKGVAIIDCFPPPTGSTSDFMRPPPFTPEVLKRFLQAGELADLHAIHRSIGGQQTTDDELLEQITSRLDFDVMPVSYSGDQYDDIRKVIPCFKTTVYLRVEYKVYQIKITANREIRIPGKTFPPGDEIATYRIRQPFRYRFESYHEYNERCCDEKPEETPEEKKTNWVTPFHSDEDEFDFKLRFDWKYWEKWGFRPRFRYDYDDSDDDEFDRYRDWMRRWFKPGF